LKYDSLLQNYNNFHCYIKLGITQPINSVSQSKNNDQALIINTIIPDHSIYLSFPSSDHSETLAIYDVLGREVKRIEIPSGASEYDLARKQFASGYYFAQLGNLNASFIVN